MRIPKIKFALIKLINSINRKILLFFHRTLIGIPNMIFKIRLRELSSDTFFCILFNLVKSRTLFVVGQPTGCLMLCSMSVRQIKCPRRNENERDAAFLRNI